MIEKICYYFSNFGILRYDGYEYLRYINHDFIFLHNYYLEIPKNDFLYYLFYFFGKFIHYFYNSFGLKRDLVIEKEMINNLFFIDYFLEPIAIFLGIFLGSFFIFLFGIFIKNIFSKFGKKFFENKILDFIFIVFGLNILIGIFLIFSFSIYYDFLSFENEIFLKNIFHIIFHIILYFYLIKFSFFNKKVSNHLEKNIFFYSIFPRILPLGGFVSNYFLAFSNISFKNKIFYLFFGSIFNFIFIYIFKIFLDFGFYDNYLKISEFCSFFEFKEIFQISIFFLIFGFYFFLKKCKKV